MAPLKLDNVDTDQIIPARYLKATDKKGFGEHLFQDLRFNEDGTPKPDFPLNKPHYKGAQILLALLRIGFESAQHRQRDQFVVAQQPCPAHPGRIAALKLADIGCREADCATVARGEQHIVGLGQQRHADQAIVAAFLELHRDLAG